MEGRDIFHRKLDTGIERQPLFETLCLNLQDQTMMDSETGTVVHITPNEYKILWTLVRAQGNLITESELSEFIYEDLPDHKDIPLSNSITSTLSRVRSKVESLTNGKMTIATERNMGFRLVLESGKQGA